MVGDKVAEVATRQRKYLDGRLARLVPTSCRVSIFGLISKNVTFVTTKNAKLEYDHGVMRLLRHNSKFISRFVLAFLCLNLGGALCLTYCIQGASAAAMSSSQMSSHCQHHKQTQTPPTQNEQASAKTVACCLMPVSLIAAPLEERGSLFTENAALGTRIALPEFAIPFLSSTSRIVECVYRPPPLDHRTDRLRNCVFRI